MEPTHLEDRPAPLLVLLVVAPAALSFVLLAAHFLRAENPFLVMVSLLLPLVLLARRLWSVRLVQALLAAGVIEWVLTAHTLVLERNAIGAPAGRLVVILAAVALFTAAAALLLETRTAHSVLCPHRLQALPPEPPARDLRGV